MRLDCLSLRNALVFGLVASTSLVAQTTTGNLKGVISDFDGRPIAGARVTLQSNVLFSPRVLTTNRKGEWFAPMLAVGQYAVTVTHDDYITSKATNIHVGLGSDGRQDLRLKPKKAAEAVVVISATASSAVAKADTKLASGFTNQNLSTLPTQGKGFDAGADLAPGVVKGAQGTISIRGGQLDRTRFTVNGVDVKDDAKDFYTTSQRGVAASVNYLEDNIEEVEVVLSPVNARHGRALGGILNVVTRQGTNEFTGSLRAKVDRDTWRGEDYHNWTYIPALNNVSDKLNRSWEVTVSGPIVKDRLWFNFGTKLKPNTSSVMLLPGVTGNDISPDQIVPWVTGIAELDAYTKGQVQNLGLNPSLLDPPTYYTYDAKNTYMEGKLTGAITADHTLEFSYSRQVDKYTNDAPGMVNRMAMLGEKGFRNQAYGLSYRGVLGPRLFVEARYNKMDNSLTQAPGDLSIGTGERVDVYMSRANMSMPGFYSTWGILGLAGNGVSANPTRHNNRSANLNFKTFLDLAGTHELDFGIDHYLFMNSTAASQGAKNYAITIGGGIFQAPGTGSPDSWRFPVMNYGFDLGTGRYVAGQGPAVGMAPGVRRFFGTDGETDTRSDALYVNDNWTISPRLTLMVGLRLDRHRVFDTEGVQKGHKQELSPRFQAKIDPDGQSRHVFTVTGARYSSDFSQNFNKVFIKTADNPVAWMYWNAEKATPYWDNAAAAGNWNYTGSVDTNRPLSDYVTFRSLQDILNLDNYGFVARYTDTSQMYQVPVPLSTPYTLEGTVGYRRSWEGGSWMQFTYVRRSTRNEWAIEREYTRDNVIIVPPPAAIASKGPQAMSTYRVFNSDKIKREYNSLEVEWNVPLSSTWTMGGNYTYSALRGNDEGGDLGVGIGGDPTNAGGFHSYRSLLAARGYTDEQLSPYGPLTIDKPHRARLHFTASLPLGRGSMNYSIMFRYESGNNYNYLYANDFKPSIQRLPSEKVDWNGQNWNVLMPTPPQKVFAYFSDRGAYTTNDQYGLDLRVFFDLPLNIQKLRLTGDLQVTNVLNQTRIQSQGSSTDATAVYSPTQNINYLSWITGPGRSGYINYNGARSVTGSFGLRF